MQCEFISLGLIQKQLCIFPHLSEQVHGTIYTCSDFYHFGRRNFKNHLEFIPTVGII